MGSFKPQVNERVQIISCEGHTLPEVLKRAALPVDAVVVREAEANGGLWWVLIEGVGEVQVHADQLRPEGSVPPFELTAEDEATARNLTMSYPGGAEAWAALMRYLHRTPPSPQAAAVFAAGPKFVLDTADLKLLTGDTSDYEDPSKAMEGVLALDARMRRFLGQPINDEEEKP